VVQGTFATKMSSCLNCEFYLQLGKEEGAGRLSTKDILARLQAL
jgi:hypothetical protein